MSINIAENICAVLSVISVYLVIKDYYRKKPTHLEPGECECGHHRCCHRDGKRGCSVSPIDGRVCACVIYIPKQVTQRDELKELRKIAGLK